MRERRTPGAGGGRGKRTGGNTGTAPAAYLTLHLTETCDTADPTTGTDAGPDRRDTAEPAGVPSRSARPAATEPDHQGGDHRRDRARRGDDRADPRPLAGRDLLPAEHYVDSGYPSAALVVDSLHRLGITLVTPLLADTSRQARAGAGYDRTGFTIDFDTQQATCPQGQTSTPWNPVSQRGTDTIVITFAAAHLPGLPGPRPVHHLRLAGGRQLTVRPRDVHQAQLAARAAQDTKDLQAEYAFRAGVEGTIRQAVAVTGIRRARYRGLPKTRLEHAYAAVAVNLIRLHAWWNGHPLDRTRTSHLTRLELALAA